MRALALTTAFSCLVSFNVVQAATTDPVGYVTWNIPAGTGSSYALSTLSLPLREAPDSSTSVVGVITSVTSDTLVNSSAGWSADAFSQAAAPYFVQITSGSAIGRIFQISTTVSNTSTTLTLETQGSDLTTLGIVASTDTYKIIPADTLSSLFGTPATTGILGATSSGAADQIYLYAPSTGWRSYYYNTSSSAWLRVGPPVNSDNIVIRPDQGLIYQRLGASALEFTITGTVPMTDSKTIVQNSGVTFLGNIWPVDTTLATSGISDMSGWVKNASSALADQVYIYSVSTGWRSYFHNGTNWVRVGPPINSDSLVLDSGSAVLVIRVGSDAGTSVLAQALPY